MTIGERSPEACSDGRGCDSDTDEGGEAAETLPKRSAAEVLTALRAVVDLYHGEALDALAAYHAATCSPGVGEAVARRALDRYVDLVEATRELSTVWAFAWRSASDDDAAAVVAGFLSECVRGYQNSPHRLPWVAAFTEDVAARLRGERVGVAAPATPPSFEPVQAVGKLGASGGP